MTASRTLAARTSNGHRYRVSASADPPRRLGEIGTQSLCGHVALPDNVNVRECPDGRGAITVGTPLWARVASKALGDRVLALQPEQLLRRRKELTLLATDLETGDGRSFPLASVVAVRAR